MEEDIFAGWVTTNHEQMGPGKSRPDGLTYADFLLEVAAEERERPVPHHLRQARRRCQHDRPQALEAVLRRQGRLHGKLKTGR